ncbi:hypothetical protein BDZ85DRAFT_49900 [Elsinoe ampelina]|uniref:Uncharacterized protein n=1 Tax=Elsinoe ampelina TaxID=302913 RepID=A0A6A6GL66_9PEZI|nr:hypothetical protein BDZ85DRAFT_49900 [Elsinoe ampelina]
MISSKDDTKQATVLLSAVTDSGKAPLQREIIQKPTRRRNLLGNFPGWKFNYGIIVITAIAPLLIGIVWGSVTARKDAAAWAFAGANIGGRMTQVLAKAIDVLCSAVIGPTLATCVNFFWDGSARTSAFNEHNPKRKAILASDAGSASDRGGFCVSEREGDEGGCLSDYVRAGDIGGEFDLLVRGGGGSWVDGVGGVEDLELGEGEGCGCVEVGGDFGCLVEREAEGRGNGKGEEVVGLGKGSWGGGRRGVGWCMRRRLRERGRG